MSISECRWNLRAWVNLLHDMQDPRINRAEIFDWLTNDNSPSTTEETLLTQVDAAFGKVDCKVLCNGTSGQCICQKNIGNLFDLKESSTWTCKCDEATIELSKLSQS